jgi:hypothetical protein
MMRIMSLVIGEIEKFTGQRFHSLQGELGLLLSTLNFVRVPCKRLCIDKRPLLILQRRENPNKAASRHYSQENLQKIDNLFTKS